MISQNTFSFFKNKDLRFDWWVIILTGMLLLLVSFLIAWYFMEVTQENSDDISLIVNETVTLDREMFDEVQGRFRSKQGSLVGILGGLEEDISSISGSQEDPEEEAGDDLEEA